MIRAMTAAVREIRREALLERYERRISAGED